MSEPAQAAPFVRFGSGDSACVDLVCLPWVGAGASPFHAWRQGMPACVGLVAVRLAGRETRLQQPVMDTMEDVVEELAQRWTVRSPRPVVLLGHCLGGIIGFELIRELRRRRLALPQRFLVVNSSAPREFVVERPRDDVDVELARQREILGHPRIFQALAPAIEADLEINRGYLYRPAAPLEVPITLMQTRRDPLSPVTVGGWRSETSRDLRLVTAVEDHPFPAGQWSELAEVVLRELTATGHLTVD